MSFPIEDLKRALEYFVQMELEPEDKEHLELVRKWFCYGFNIAWQAQEEIAMGDDY